MENGIHIRTGQRLIKHADDCNMMNRYLPYSPNAGWRKKGDTVSLLEPPEVQDKSELGIKKPRHDSEPLNWSANETAAKLLEIFEKVTRGRKIDEMEDVAQQFEELLREPYRQPAGRSFDDPPRNLARRRACGRDRIRRNDETSKKRKDQERRNWQANHRSIGRPSERQWINRTSAWRDSQTQAPRSDDR